MKLRVLVYGAGTIGSIFAGKLVKSGVSVTVLARGKRYEELKSKGLILRNAMNNRVETYRINCIKELTEEDVYSYILVVVQNNQLDSILPILRKNRSKNIVFVVNNPLGYEKYTTAVGTERVMIGFPSAGGERRDGVVTYFIGTGIARIMQSTTFGEIDGQYTERLRQLVKLFRKAGFDPAKSTNMDAWQKTHVAFVIPIANALYQYESNNYKLAKSRKTIKTMILATREGFRALKDNRIKVEPIKLHYYYLPLWLLITVFQIMFSTRIAEYAMAKHTVVAKEEIDILDNQFQRFFNVSSSKHWKELNKTSI